ncbi:MAG: phosphohydrolase [Candidatus Bathyarchaeia archaeon]
MVTVSNRLVFNRLEEPRVRRIFQLMESDMQIQTYLRMSNSMVVDRMNYNDHGPVHARICSGAALEVFRLLTNNIEPTTVTLGVTDLEGAKIVVLCGSYLHDLGNSIHRDLHHIHSCYLASPILDHLIGQVYRDDLDQAHRIKCEVLHAIYSHDEGVSCLSVEAGAAKVADGTDMAEGRARIPYRSGRTDIHSISATAIEKVELKPGKERAVKIIVHMSNPAGIFQIQEVLARKISTSGIQEHVEVVARVDGEEMRTFQG